MQEHVFERWMRQAQATNAIPEALHDFGHQFLHTFALDANGLVELHRVDLEGIA